MLEWGEKNTAQKNKLENSPVEDKYKYKYKLSKSLRPTVSELFGKDFTNFCRALYGDAILVYSFGTPIWPPEINKNISRSLFL